MAWLLLTGFNNTAVPLLGDVTHYTECRRKASECELPGVLHLLSDLFCSTLTFIAWTEILNEGLV